jgi:hypothetical protein
MAVATFTIPLRVGDVLYGYCNGNFDNDLYGDKRVEAIGADWVVVREDESVLVYRGNPESLTRYRQKPDDQI